MGPEDGSGGFIDAPVGEDYHEDDDNEEGSAFPSED